MNDFPSDKILENYKALNEITWRGEDSDVCRKCGMRYEEVNGHCNQPACPFEEENLNADGSEE